MRCKKCGTPLAIGLRECAECGFPVFNDEEEELTPPPELDTPPLRHIYFGKADTPAPETPSPLAPPPAAPPAPKPRAPRAPAKPRATKPVPPLPPLTEREAENEAPPAPAPRQAAPKAPAKEEPAPPPQKSAAQKKPAALGRQPLDEVDDEGDSSEDLRRLVHSIFAKPAAKTPAAANKPMLLKKPAPKLPPLVAARREAERAQEKASRDDLYDDSPYAPLPPPPAAEPKRLEPLAPRPENDEPAWTLGTPRTTQTARFAEPETAVPLRGPEKRAAAETAEEEYRIGAFHEDSEEAYAREFETADTQHIERVPYDDEEEAPARRGAWREALAKGWARVKGVFSWESEEQSDADSEDEALVSLSAPAGEDLPQDEEDAPQEDEIRVVVASATRRFLATLVDGALLFLVLWLFGVLALAVFGPERLPETSGSWAVFGLLLDYSQHLALPFAESFLVLAILYTLLFSATSGQTPGQLLFGLRLIQCDGERLGLPRAVLRLFAIVLAAAPFCLGLLWASVDAKKQGLHDKLAQTLVIHLEDEPARVALSPETEDET